MELEGVIGGPIAGFGIIKVWDTSLSFRSQQCEKDISVEQIVPSYLAIANLKSVV